MTELNYDISELTPVNYLDWILQTDYTEGCKIGDIVLNDNDKIDDRNYYIYEIAEKCIADIKIINKVNAKVLNIKHKGEILVIQGGINADKETLIKVEGKNIAVNNLILNNVGLFVTESFNFLLSGKSTVKDFNLKAEGVVKLYGDIKSEAFYIQKYPVVELDDNRHIISEGNKRVYLEAKTIECGNNTLISSVNNELILKVQDYARIHCNILSAPQFGVLESNFKADILRGSIV
jgi:lipocalin